MPNQFLDYMQGSLSLSAETYKAVPQAVETDPQNCPSPMPMFGNFGCLNAARLEELLNWLGNTPRVRGIR